MSEFFLDRRDIEFILYEQFGIDKFSEKFERYKEYTKETYDTILDSAIQFAKEKLAPHRQEADKIGVKLENGKVILPEFYKDSFKEFAELGFIGPTQDEELGGMALPTPVYTALMEVFIAADPSFMFYPGLTAAAANLLAEFGSQEIKEVVIPKMLSGQWTGTMCLTEPQAGTALQGITTKAIPTDEPGVFKIEGNKIFITGGDNDLAENIIHLVLARVPGDPPTTKGISLFLVPKYRFDKEGNITEFNDVKVTAVEEKMGIHASATCALSFGEDGNCYGYLIGEQRRGLPIMFRMMNEARIACGIQGSATANAAFQLALAYAKERKQGPDITKRDSQEWVPIIQHPDVRRNLMIAKAYSEGIRALLQQAATYADFAQHHSDPDVREHYQDLLDLLTPICKAYPTDKGFKVTELAIQVHGGYGYIKEYGVEQYMRDVKIASIYEGTNGVQALDLLGRKMQLKGGGLFLRWIQDTNEFIEKAKEHAAAKKFENLIEAVEKAKNKLFEVGFSFQERSQKNLKLSLLGATPFLEMFGHVAVAVLFLQQALIAEEALQKLTEESGKSVEELVNDNENARFYYNKIKTAQFFIKNILPEAHSIARQIMNEDSSALEVMF